jgi:DNA repair photolyase
MVRQIEPGAPSFKRRMKALKRLHDARIVTSVRVNPLFPNRPDGYYTDPASLNERFANRETVPELNLYDEDFIPQIAESGVKSVVAGFVRLSGNAINAISRQVGIDFKTFFRPELRKGGNGDNVYSPKEIAQYYKIIQSQCAKSNLRFSTCYIGTGIKEFYKHQDLWTNKTDCCDIIGRLPSFQKSSQDISWETRLKHAPNKADALIAKTEEEMIFSESNAPKIELPRNATKRRDSSEINL